MVQIKSYLYSGRAFETPVSKGLAKASANIFNTMSRILFHSRVRAYDNAIDVITCNEPDLMKSIDCIRREHDMLLTNSEAYMINSAVKSTDKLSGDIAEVGVYRGGSAKLICQGKGDRTLHLFDTFEGLPHDDEGDSGFVKGMYSANYEDVKRAFANEKNVYLYKGWFPDTAGPIKDRKFSFVHLDVDLYESTVACLNFFYDRMEKGGILLSHDYEQEGVKKAFTEFFKGKPEVVIGLVSRQCIVVKT